MTFQWCPGAVLVTLALASLAVLLSGCGAPHGRTPPVSIQGDLDAGSASGHFDWRAIEVSSLPRLEGRRARELLEGRVNSDGRLSIHGVRIEDPLEGLERQEAWGSLHVLYRERGFMAVDHYRITITETVVTGESRTHERDWSGGLTGRRVGCGGARSAEAPS